MAGHDEIRDVLQVREDGEGGRGLAHLAVRMRRFMQGATHVLQAQAVLLHGKENSILLHVGNPNIKKMIEMALEGNTMLYRHSPIKINERHTKMA